MATFNVEMRQRVSGAFSDIIYPKAHWGNIDGKPSTFAPTAHEHSVSDIDATGTPSSTTYLRGDGAWATPSVEGGSAINSIIDYTCSANATSVDFTSLSLTASKTYHFYILFKGSPQLLLRFNNLTASGYRWVRDTIGTSSSITNKNNSSGVALSENGNASNAGSHSIIQGTISIDSAGYVAVSYREMFCSSNAIFMTNGWGRYMNVLSDGVITSLMFLTGDYIGSKIGVGSVIKLWEVI